MRARSAQRDLFTKRIRALPPAPEYSLHVMIADVLRRWSSPDWRWTHIPLGEYRPPATAARLQRMGVMPGWPDFILLSPAGVAHFLELKRSKGGRLSPAQADFTEWCIEHGVACEVRYRFDDALQQLKAWGAVRASVSA